MSLEFTKLVDQIKTMGRYYSHLDASLSSRIELALAWFYSHTTLDPINERIQLVRRSVSGYRGAASPEHVQEIICGVGDPDDAPTTSTILAVDGSQVYPDLHASALYYLLNIGAFTFYHGQLRIPEQFTIPELFYAPTEIEDRDGRAITNQTVNARRSVLEMEWLANLAWDLRDEQRPLIAFHDGSLLKFFGATEVADAGKLEARYLTALNKLRDSGAVLAGYLDKSRSANVISLLHLMSLPEDQVDDAHVKTNGQLEGLIDAMLFYHVLERGQRSAIMTPNSPQNLAYKRQDDTTGDLEICFFYLNVSDSAKPNIVRVEIPMWVARQPQAVAALHSLILIQCAAQGRKRYPYVLTRADELAYVSSIEKQQLDEILRVEMMRNQLSPETSTKLQSKSLARSHKRQHRLG